MFDKKNILGVGITDASEKDILEYIIRGLEKDNEKWYIVTVNPEILMLANKNNTYQKILNNAKLALPDGIGIILAGKILGKPLKQRITGTDLLENLCRLVSEKPITVGFLGGMRGVAEKTAECLVSRYPNLKIGFIGEEWDAAGFTRARKHKVSGIKYYAEENNKNILNTKYIIPFGLAPFGKAQGRQGGHNTIDILFVAFGAPKQEIWIAENLDKIPVKVAIGVGGAFDYISGKTSRAPSFIRNIGLEWLFRLIVQPWRWKRQLALLEFIWLVIKEKLKKN